MKDINRTTIRSNHLKNSKRGKRRIKQRRLRKVRLFAFTAPAFVLVLLLGWRLTKSDPNTDYENILTSQNTTFEDDTNDIKQQPEETESHITKTQNANDWNLILVNPWNHIPEKYEIKKKILKNGHAVDERCYPDLQKMMDDCRAAGYSPLICSSYRTKEKQERLYNNNVKSFVSQGYSEANAQVEAGKSVAVPGTSEHQLGLAVDIVDINNQNLDSSQEGTKVQQWLMHNSWKYGFILRYPSDKSNITGIIYEPWHYRYVGNDAAKYIYENAICFEEYLEMLK